MAETATPILLDQPIADGGIRSINFFNGRLLTGSDLSREQAARGLADRRVAQALGSGIARGLEVRSGTDWNGGPTLLVQPGLAVSRSGRTLWLDQPATVAIGRRAPPRVQATRSFDACQRLPGGTYAVGPGIYLLTLAPIEDRAGRALTNALDDAAVPCNTDTLIDAVRFRLLGLDALLQDEVDAVDQRQPRPSAAQRLSLLRNRIAHRCLGTDTLARFIADPLAGAPGADYGLLAELRDSALTDCDVPLAIVKLDIGIDFVDMWSVRRRITQPSSGGAWALGVDDRRRAEGEAGFMQFQGQVSNLATARTKVVLQEHFDFLPAVGLVPFDATDSVTLGRLFAGLTVRGPAYIEGAGMGRLLRASHEMPAIDLGSRELIWLYVVRENRPTQVGPVAPESCIVFASGHLPYAADARFDIARFSKANFSI